MPEGPEIRRAADRIANVLQDRIVDKVWFGLPALQGREIDLSGRRVMAVKTQGKAMLTCFDNDLVIYSHNQLYGRWYVVKRERYPTTRRSLRLALHTEEHSALLYSASDIAVLESDDLPQHPFLSRLGPDILDTTLHWRDVAKRLQDPRFNRRRVSSLYLDQGFLAGIGNYLRSEILFAAGINPDTRPADLHRKQLNGLARSTLAISQRAYETGGITNPPGLVARLKKQGLKRSQFRHGVFGRNGSACYECGETVLKEAMAGRRLYWCPLCQY